MPVAEAFQNAPLVIPAWVVDLDSFHRWTESDEVPDEARICYLQGDLWIDMREQQVYTHLRVKAEFTGVLRIIEREERRGFYLADGLRLSHPEAELSVIPDGTFTLYESMNRGRVRMVPGKEGGFVRMEGVPDMLLEIVSDSSVKKDTVRLKERYWHSGVPEYWLVDARKEPLSFNIFRHTAKGYRPTRKTDGWMKSSVLGKAVHLTQTTDRFGNPDYRLEVR